MYGIPAMPIAKSTLSSGPAKPRVARFYKIDHVGDPELLSDGRIRLGTWQCKARLRAGITAADITRDDNLIVAIGGSTARDGLCDRLAWAGIAVSKQEDGRVVCDRGFFLMSSGPLEWRTSFPALADWVDSVTQGHRVARVARLPGERRTGTSAAVAAELIRLYQWGLKLAVASTSTSASSGAACPAAKPTPMKTGLAADCSPKKLGC